MALRGSVGLALTMIVGSGLRGPADGLDFTAGGSAFGATADGDVDFRRRA